MSTTPDIDYLVRVAEPNDAGPLIEMLCRLLAEPDGSGFRDFYGRPYPVSEKVITETVRFIVAPENHDKAVCGVVDVAGEITGSVGLVVANPWYSEKRYLGDVWRCVVPEARYHAQHQVLVDFALRVKQRMRLDIIFGNFAESRVQARDRLLERMVGVKKYGSTFLVPYVPEEEQRGAA